MDVFIEVLNKATVTFRLTQIKTQIMQLEEEKCAFTFLSDQTHDQMMIKQDEISQKMFRKNVLNSVW